MRRRLLLVLLAGLALLAIWWVPPLVLGPTVDCTQLGVPSDCDEAVAVAIAGATEYNAPPISMPVASVSVSGPNARCVSYSVVWVVPLFGVSAQVLC